MSISEATGLLGTILTFGVIFKAMDNISGTPHRLEEVHDDKESAHRHAQRLKTKGKKARVVKKTKNGHTKYAVYTKVEKKPKKKKPKKKATKK